jgi:hypothetical protein
MHDTRAALVRVTAPLLLGLLLLSDLFLIGLSPGVHGRCVPRHCPDALTSSLAVGPLCWLVAIVCLAIAVSLPGHRAFGTARALMLLVSAACGLAALLVLTVMPA